MKEKRRRWGREERRRKSEAEVWSLRVGRNGKRVFLRTGLFDTNSISSTVECCSVAQPAEVLKHAANYSEWCFRSKSRRKIL